MVVTRFSVPISTDWRNMVSYFRETFSRACLADASEGAAPFLAALDEVIDSVVEPAAAQVDRDAAHPGDALDALSAIGATGVQIPREFGGLGHDNGVAALVVERTARACASTAAILMFHYQVVNRTLTYAHPARRDADLVAFANGALAASAWTEPNAGRDKTDLRTRLHDDGNGPEVDGVKTFCTGLRSATVIDVLLAADLPDGTGPTFVRVDTKAGVEIDEIYPMLGLRGTATGTVRLRAAPVTATDVLGGLGSAKQLMAANHLNALNPGLLALGIASGAADAALRAAGDTTRTVLAETVLPLEAAYSYAAELVRAMTADPDRALGHSGRFKAHATTVARQVTQQLLPAMGSRGFLATFPFERHLRDAQATALMGPINQLCLNRVADDLLPGDRHPT
jgi:alkylation response protein AidB-like acyl-CoA dehydrogenase